MAAGPKVPKWWVRRSAAIRRYVGRVDPLAFTCPRCGAAASERFYGPCDRCRGTLRAEQYRPPQEVEVEAYEPKMNVVPNQVATKD